MASDLQNQQRRLWNRLRLRLRKLPTRELTIRCADEINKVTVGGFSASPFVSPAKSCMLIMGLMLESKQDKNGGTLTQEEWEKIVRIVNDIFNVEVDIFFGSAKDRRIEEYKRFIGTNAFVSQHLQTPLISTPEARSRLASQFAVFNAEIKAGLGLSLSELIACLDAIEEQLKAQVLQHNSLAEIYGAMERDDTQHVLHALAQVGYPGDRATSAHANVAPATMVLEEGRISERNPLWREFADIFTSKRQPATLFNSLRDQNPFEERPLVRAEDGTLLCPYYHGLVVAIMHKVEQILITNRALAPKYYNERATDAEKRTKRALRVLLPPTARVLSGASENMRGEYEHDLIIETPQAILIAEVKSSPPRRVRDDAATTFDAVQRSFADKSGIQGGYNQAERLRTALLDKPEVQLFKDKQPITIAQNGREIFVVVATLDDFGYLSANVSVLLAPSAPEARLPWVASCSAILTICEAFQAEGLSWDDFLMYLRQRTTTQGTVYSSDELEFAGLFVLTRDLETAIRREHEKGFPVALNPELSSIVTDYFNERHGVHQPRRQRFSGRPFISLEA